MFTPFKIKSRFFKMLLQVFVIILYIDFLPHSESVKDGICLAVFDPISFAIQIAIMVAVSMLLAPRIKTPKRKPTGLEEFDVPTAEEGRPIQVLFGKKFILSPNVVWYGHLKSQAIKA